MKKVFGLIIALFLLFSPALVLARAGGGEDFGGGGFDSGGSDSFDWDSSDSGTTYSGGTSSSSTESSVGFIVVIIIVVIIVLASRRKKGLQGPDIGSGSTENVSQTEDEVKAQLAKLKEIDPAFDEQKFKTHAKKVFMAVQKGWTERDQTVCRPFMAEEVFQSHQMQIDTMKSQKIINVLKNIVVGGIDFAKIELGNDYHKIYTKVRAQMRDFKVKEDEPDKPISGEVNATEPFTEYWVFIRKSNLKTKVKDGIFDRKCPNCGAPVKIDVAGICKYCNANVVNGDYDWVLSEIIQSSEWTI